MHIAICDDNFADRKQTERLLKKESDTRRNTSGTLYVDSYGNVEALTKAPMIYDLFLIDLTKTSPNGIETATLLRSMGVTAPIALCCSSINYRSFAHIPENTLFIDKPINSLELSNIISTALVKKKMVKPTIELRGEQQTHYVCEEDIVYAAPIGHTVNVYLADGTLIHQLGNMNDFIIAISSFTSFMIVGKNVCINLSHIREIQGSTLIMDDCSRIHLHLSDKKRIREFME